MRLKIFTTACLITGLVMMVAYPWVIGQEPLNASRRDLALWGARSLSYVALLMGIFLAAALGAALIIRKQRREFEEEQTRNLAELVKGTLEDHARKQQP